MTVASVTAISNQKGGVGKTTSTFNIGKNLADMGRKVLLIDNDPQASLTLAVFGMEDIPPQIRSVNAAGVPVPGPSNTFHLYEKGTPPVPYQLADNLFLIGASMKLADVGARPASDTLFDFRENVDALRDQFDFILIDCLPSFGNMMTAAQMTADYILVPTNLDAFSYEGVEMQLGSAITTRDRLNQKLKIIGIFANEVNNPKLSVEEHYWNLLKNKYGDFLFETKITRSAKVKESNAFGKSIKEYKKWSDQARQYDELVSEMLERMDRESN